MCSVGMRELKRSWQVRTFNVMWPLAAMSLTSQIENGHCSGDIDSASPLCSPPPPFFFPEFSFKQQTNPFSFSKYFVHNGQSDIFWLPNPLLSLFREFPSLRKYLFFPLYSCLMYTSSQKHKCILGGLCMLVLQSGCACKKKFCASILTFPFGSCFSLLSNMSDEKPQRPEGQIFSLFFLAKYVTHLNMSDQFQFLNLREFYSTYSDVPFREELTFQVCLGVTY